ncbi:MAG: transcriptional regulator of molybdate metabolism, LysR family [Enterovirga sp.]|nr:transcriptional regulator of molybdate metabolism, LysR family [Enterovirga sp.]
MAVGTLWVDGSVQVGSVALPVRQTAALLAAIDDERSLRAAAERLDLSYRSVWGRLVLLETALGRPVASKTKGHGSVLTPAGLALRHALCSAAARLDAVLAEEGRLLGERLRELTAEPQPVCRIACSHDPMLVEVLADLPGFAVAVVGSSEAVQRLLAGRVDAAGFHVCPGPDGAERMPTGLDAAEFTIHPLFRREQGLIVAAGNPLAISSLEDLTRPDVSFVNRQKGSGTRSWIDHLLAREGVRAAAVRGYETEEFTHLAVAATVASGMASAGMGVRTAAERLGLGFVPLAEETYFLAARRPESHPAVSTLLDRLDTEAHRPR